MTKESGLGWTSLSVDDSGGTLRDIRTDVTNLQFATPRGVQDITGIDKSAYERLLLLSDMSMTLNGVFDDGSNLAHTVFSTCNGNLPAGGREILLNVSGQILGTTPQVAMWITDYNLTRAQSGEFTWTAPMVLANGVIPTWTT